MKRTEPIMAMLVSLGCAKNLVDSEVMVSQLTSMGYAMTPDPAAAVLILVNTCGFLESAVQEAIETILDLARYKESGSCKTAHRGGLHGSALWQEASGPHA